MFKYFSGMLGMDVGIDLGSSNIVVYVKDKGIVLSEPSAIAAKKLPRAEGYEIIAVGNDAKAMLGKVPHGIEAIWPLEGGVIANFDMTQELLKFCLKRVSSNSSFMVHPRVVISIPAEVTEVERKAVIDATLGAGASEAYVVEEPISAALGVGLPIDKPNGCMVIDIGGGTSEVSVISLGGIVVTSSLRNAGRS
ncbi:MAG: rod shape-determining protein, partial [Synergistaceae bacterium]|nr:rod shape-determining protein [Synergistaceae bacterium]